MTIRITPFGNSILMNGFKQKSTALNITKREMTEHLVPPDGNTSLVIQSYESESDQLLDRLINLQKIQEIQERQSNVLNDSMWCNQQNPYSGHLMNK